MSVQDQARLGGAIALAVIFALLLARHRLGVLNAASWLVIVGGAVIVGEHAQFALSLALALQPADPSQPINLAHARLHFFMAGIYTLIAVVLLGVIARTLLRTGHPVGWLAVLFALVFGGGWDLVMGGLLYPHGSPLYQVFGVPVQGFGWESLYTYPVAWITALVISYQPIFRAAPTKASKSGGRKS
jgi:hypothetical protein